MRKKMLLLGAGASQEAGIPTTAAMTRAIIDHLEADFHAGHNGTREAINFICGALIAQDSARGANPYAAVDVERLFSAVQLLSARRDLEVAPFVAAWHPRVATFEHLRQAVSFDREFGKIISGETFAKKPSELFRTLLTDDPGEASTFLDLLQGMLIALRQIVAIAPDISLEYLAPIMDLGRVQGELTIATLNYDLSIERCAALGGTDLTTGVSHWSEGGALLWPKADIRLIKLHGSVDWFLIEDPGAAPGSMHETRLVVTEDADRFAQPALIFGQREKLRAEGPFLDLLTAFRDDLRAADDLVVVGYSFRDAHVNLLIRRWMNSDHGRQLTVVDPAFPPLYGFWDPTFQSELVRSLIPPRWPTEKQPSFPARLTVYRASAGDALTTALGLETGSPISAVTE